MFFLQRLAVSATIVLTMAKFLLPIVILSLLLCSCKSYLKSESGLYDVELNRSLRVPLDGWWHPDKPTTRVSKKHGRVYVAPLDISQVEDDEPELSRLLIPQMHDYMVTYLSKTIEQANKKNKAYWRLTDDANKADIRMDMAVVSLKPQRPVLRWLFFLGSFASPIPGTGTVAAHFTEGDICIEFTIRDSHTGELLFAMKDSNRATTRLYKAEAYTREGQADKNLKLWAQKIAHLVRYYTEHQGEKYNIEEALPRPSLVKGLILGEQARDDQASPSPTSQQAPELQKPVPHAAVLAD